ncbi:MAG: DUF1566 domain-containing protein [Candidatus Scalindua sp.]|jgi:hypothetical protein|nr:DUF1566 domain-containing protein [Candidatus Scalindua sp.]
MLKEKKRDKMEFIVKITIMDRIKTVAGLSILGLLLFCSSSAEVRGNDEEREVNTHLKASAINKTKFRSASREKFIGKLAMDMLKDNDFYDGDWNSSASGFSNDFQLQNVKVVHDYASGLTWQQSGSVNEISYIEAKRYVTQLNSDQFAGYNDWRLPTLEEAMSLMEPTEKNNGMYIDLIFDNTQRWIWTSDTNEVALAWLANFVCGKCYTYPNDYFDFTSGGYVRAAR